MFGILIEEVCHMNLVETDSRMLAEMEAALQQLMIELMETDVNGWARIERARQAAVQYCITEDAG